MNSIAALTGGGCAPGLDPAMYGLTNSLHPEYKIRGIMKGWKSIVEGNPNVIDLDPTVVNNWIRSSGTSLKTSRVEKFNPDLLGLITKSFDWLDVQGIEGIVAAGGDDTLGNALYLKQNGFNIIGVPKTMDLDLRGTYSVGFQSYVQACNRAILDYIEVLKSHERVGVVEVFGRHSGFTAAEIGMVTGACYIGIPEIEIIPEDLKNRVIESFRQQGWALVVVSEAIQVDNEEEKEVKVGIDGHRILRDRDSGKFVANLIKDLTKLDTISTQYDHTFRGQMDSYDAMAGLRLGLEAAKMVRAKHWGHMIAMNGDQLEWVPLENFQGTRKIDENDYRFELVTGRNTGKF